jgi:hypothetical protein
MSRRRKMVAGTGITGNRSNPKPQGTSRTPSPAFSAAMVRSSISAVIFGVLGCLVGSAGAHDPGLSLASLRLSPTQLTAHLTFARRDIETRLPIDTDHDGTVTAAEFAAARPHLDLLAPGMLDISVDDQSVAAQHTAIELDQSDAIHVQLDFPLPTGTRLNVSSPLIAQLARGHRQYVSVRDAAGTLVTEHILDAERSAFALALAHVVAATPAALSFLQFLRLGVEHMITGYDHVLFLFALLIVGNSVWSAAKLITSFTVAHSITLALATFNVVHLPPHVVEPLIAISIIYVGLENLWHRHLQHRWLLTFGFGLIHGLGFASVLRDLGIGGSRAIVPLLAFNGGVELGQVAMALLVLPLVWQAQQLPRLVPHFATVCSALVTLAGTYWLLERTIWP